MKKASVQLKQRPPVRGLGQAIGAFILGATAGSVIVLLFAPASGQVTRRKIGLKFRALSRTAARQLKVTQRLLATQAEHLREAASSRVNHAREWMIGHVANGAGSRRQSRRAVRHA